MGVKIGFVKGDSWISKSIRWFGKAQTGGARFNHVFFIFDEQFTVEALFKGLRSRNFHEAYDKEKVLVYDIPSITEGEATDLKIACLKDLGKFKSIYGYFKLPLMASDGLLSLARRKPTFFFSRVFSTKWFPICSHFVSRMLYREGHMKLFKDWKKFSPDLMDDLMKEHKSIFLVDVMLSTF